ncbi:MAG: hypothetical protein KAX49_08140 [Halanaerobiales bacterium]|nr:hypothetical protein [Halanaerobiales bacterium]
MGKVAILTEKKYNNFTIEQLVNDLKLKNLLIWWKTETNDHQMEIRYTYQEKIAKKKVMNKFLKNITSEFKQIPDTEEKREVWLGGTYKGIQFLIQDILDLTEYELDSFLSDQVFDLTKEFIIKAQNFDPTIKMADIFQALRNAWVMFGIQAFFDQKIELTSSIFAYSMIYPYTDNYLDNPKFSVEKKKEFNIRLKKHLYGEDVQLKNPFEEKIFKLIEMIEDQYPRKEFPQIYESLLAIHQAQEKSLLQHRGKRSPYETDILGISFEKGGTSVLADAYLVKGWLSKDEAEFMFGYGVFLQLIDDLQDMMEDLENEHMTVFSQLIHKWPLDHLTNRILHFLEDLLDTAEQCPSLKVQRMRGLLMRSFTLIIQEQIVRNNKGYSKNYIKTMENYSVFHYSYLRKVRRKLNNNFLAVVNKLDYYS